jgi:hypothetical protein
MKTSCPVAMVTLTHSLESGYSGARKEDALHSGFRRDAVQKLMSQSSQFSDWNKFDRNDLSCHRGAGFSLSFIAISQATYVHSESSSAVRAVVSFVSQTTCRQQWLARSG